MSEQNSASAKACDPEGRLTMGQHRAVDLPGQLADASASGLAPVMPPTSPARDFGGGLVSGDGPDNPIAHDFFGAVLVCVSCIPEGRVLSYGDVAELVGSRAARAVGWVLARGGDEVPWHRVVRSDGTFAAHLRLEQAARLSAEGIRIERDRIDMSTSAGIRWIPEVTDLPSGLTERVPRSPSPMLRARLRPLGR